eukprot:1195733-Prorocentrum_minimum.AAC.11
MAYPWRRKQRGAPRAPRPPSPGGRRRAGPGWAARARAPSWAAAGAPRPARPRICARPTDPPLSRRANHNHMRK